MKSVFIFVGTRPEAIKLVPVYQALKKSDSLRVRLVATGQHREMLHSVLKFFESPAEVDFDIMRHNQSLGEVASSILSETSKLLARERPSLVVVQGIRPPAWQCPWRPSFSIFRWLISRPACVPIILTHHFRKRQTGELPQCWRNSTSHQRAAPPTR